MLQFKVMLIAFVFNIFQMERLTPQLMKTCKANGIAVRDRLADVGNDGAAVMIGEKSGVATRFKEVCMLIMSCFSYNINEYSIMHCWHIIFVIYLRSYIFYCKSVSLYVQSLRNERTASFFKKIFNAYFDNIHKFYESSSVRMNGLKKTQVNWSTSNLFY